MKKVLIAIVLFVCLSFHIAANRKTKVIPLQETENFPKEKRFPVKK